MNIRLVMCDVCFKQLPCSHKLIRSKLCPCRWEQHMHKPDSISLWGGEVSINQENDLIMSVNDSIVNKLIAPLSTVRGISLYHIPHSWEFSSLLCGPKIAAHPAMHYCLMFSRYYFPSLYLGVLLCHLAAAQRI